MAIIYKRKNSRTGEEEKFTSIATAVSSIPEFLFNCPVDKAIEYVEEAIGESFPAFDHYWSVEVVSKTQPKDEPKVEPKVIVKEVIKEVVKEPEKTPEMEILEKLSKQGIDINKLQEMIDLFGSDLTTEKEKVKEEKVEQVKTEPKTEPEHQEIQVKENKDKYKKLSEFSSDDIKKIIQNYNSYRYNSENNLRKAVIPYFQDIPSNKTVHQINFEKLFGTENLTGFESLGYIIIANNMVRLVINGKMTNFSLDKKCLLRDLTTTGIVKRMYFQPTKELDKEEMSILKYIDSFKLGLYIDYDKILVNDKLEIVKNGRNGLKYINLFKLALVIFTEIAAANPDTKEDITVFSEKEINSIPDSEFSFASSERFKYDVKAGLDKSLLDINKIIQTDISRYNAKRENIINYNKDFKLPAGYIFSLKRNKLNDKVETRHFKTFFEVINFLSNCKELTGDVEDIKKSVLKTLKDSKDTLIRDGDKKSITIHNQKNLAISLSIVVDTDYVKNNRYSNLR